MGHGVYMNFVEYLLHTKTALESSQFNIQV